MPSTDTPPRVVVVDDDSGLRDSMVALLEAYGAEVVGVAGDGASGIDVAARTRPDVVLMDLRMPELDGLDATVRLRAADPTAQVVLLSAYDDPGLIESARSKGAYAYLVKGCRGTHIFEVVTSATSVARALRERPGETETLRVIVADDVAEVREGLRALFGAHGIEVVAEAADGLTAVGIALALRPNVAIVDCRMPGLDGITAAQHITARAPEVAVLVHTAHTDTEFARAARTAGAYGFLWKGTPGEDIVAAVREAAVQARPGQH